MQLLQLKHWQIFLLTFGLFLFGILAANVLDDPLKDYELNGIGAYSIILIVSQFLCIITTNCWFYVIGSRLHQKNSYSNFRLALYKSLIYISSVLTILGFAEFMIIALRDYHTFTLALLFNMLMIIFCSSFAARLLKMAELKRSVSFKNFYGTFFGFIFYPIGVWNIQPRINKIFENETEGFDSNGPIDQHLDISN